MPMQQVQHQQVDSLQQSQMRNNLAQLPNNNIEYDQIGIDFVLTYDSHGNPLRVPAPYPSPPR